MFNFCLPCCCFLFKVAFQPWYGYIMSVNPLTSVPGFTSTSLLLSKTLTASSHEPAVRKTDLLVCRFMWWMMREAASSMMDLSLYTRLRWGELTGVSAPSGVVSWCCKHRQFIDQSTKLIKYSFMHHVEIIFYSSSTILFTTVKI